MKVVQINAVCGTGSTGRVALDISQALTRNNIDNLIAYSSGKTIESNVIKIGNKFEHKLHSLFSHLFGMQGYFSYFSTKKLLKFLKKYKPDVIHLHNLHNNYINLKLLFEFVSKNNIATVVTLHDCFYYTGGCVYYTIAGCDSWKRSCGKCPQLKEGNPSWFFDRTDKMLSDRKHWYSNIEKMGVIGVSHWVTNEAKESVLCGAKVFKTIYNWVDLEVFYPHKTNVRKKLRIENKYVILGVAYSWIESKGINDFNRLADMLDDRFKIVLVGQACRCINKKIINIPRTEDMNQLSDLYADADIFYNPTRRETFGKVTAEALACGAPVITYDTTACAELVTEACGYVEQIGDLDAVYNDIMKIIDSDIDYTTNCREFARDNFDKEKCLNQTIGFYKELLDD